MSSNLQSLKPLPRKARNDYRACLHAIWSEPEGSSHSGNIVCRGVAGGVASITLNRLILNGFHPLPRGGTRSDTSVSTIPSYLLLSRYSVCYFRFVVPDVIRPLFPQTEIRRSL